MQYLTAIILLNWNGSSDTIGCLDSLQAVQGNFCVVVADNGSTDDSLDRLYSYKQKSDIRIHILPLGNNYGFAKGNNLAIKYAQEKIAPDRYLLLNNDTVVTPDFLAQLQKSETAHPDYKVFTPRINYWYDKNLVWLCGGRLGFGTRKPFFRNRNSQTTSLPDFLPVSFVSGCALYCPASFVDKDGKLLTERFFFGEEDYDFSLRMKKEGVCMACVTTSVIYHKVGSSISADDKTRLGRWYMYYLGRLICARQYYCRFSFFLIRTVSCLNAARYFKKCLNSWKDALNISSRLMSEAKTKNGISYADFRSLVVEHDYHSKRHP